MGYVQFIQVGERRVLPAENAVAAAVAVSTPNDSAAEGGIRWGGSRLVRVPGGGYVL